MAYTIIEIDWSQIIDPFATPNLASDTLLVIANRDGLTKTVIRGTGFEYDPATGMPIAGVINFISIVALADNLPRQVVSAVQIDMATLGAFIGEAAALRGQVNWFPLIDQNAEPIEFTATRIVLQNTDGSYTVVNGNSLDQQGGELSGTVTSIELLADLSSPPMEHIGPLGADLAVAATALLDLAASEQTYLLAMQGDNVITRTNTDAVIPDGGDGIILNVDYTDAQGADQVIGSGVSSIDNFHYANYSLAPYFLELDLTAQTGLIDGDAPGETYSVPSGQLLHAIGTDFSDTMVGNGLSNVLFGGLGNDDIGGGDGGDTLDGGVGDDDLTGGSGVDALYGGDGNDRLDGGTDHDDMTGGAGNDTYVVDDALDTVSENFDGGIDLVMSDRSYTLGANLEDLMLIGAGGWTGTGNALANTINGNEVANTLYGLDGNDTLNGNGGNDTLVGGNGNDALTGGDGDDVFATDAGADSMDGGIGTDRASYYNQTVDLEITLNNASGDVRSHGGTAEMDHLFSVENVTGGRGNDQIVGYEAANLIDGYLGNDEIWGAGGNDTLRGGDGNDTLNGGAGVDQLDGGNGTDTTDYSDEVDNIVVNLGTGVGTGGDAQGDRYVSIENATGGSGNDTFAASLAANVIDGYNGVDRVTYSSETVGLTIVLNDDLVGATSSNGGRAEGDILVNVENATAGQGNDFILGNSSANLIDGYLGNDWIHGGAGSDILRGGDGDDTLMGDAGADTIQGGNGRDVADYFADTANIVIYLTGQAGVGGDAQGDRLSGIEDAFGGSGNDTLNGDAAANWLAGSDGNDTLVGNAGNDELWGEAGNDVFNGGAGADTMGGGDGTDRVTYSGQTADLVIHLDGTACVGGDAAGDTLADIEYVTAGAGNDYVWGNSSDNLLVGLDGNDNLYGAGGNDILRGGNGGDLLRGDSGNDTLTGDAGDDQFVFADGWGIDRITDFAAADTEQIDLGSVTNITDFDDLVANHAREVGGVLELYDGSNVIVLEGYTLADLGAGQPISSADFLF
jgi:Ca2+-binding RTX toxin-like protein